MLCWGIFQVDVLFFWGFKGGLGSGDLGRSGAKFECRHSDISFYWTILKTFCDVCYQKHFKPFNHVLYEINKLNYILNLIVNNMNEKWTDPEPELFIKKLNELCFLPNMEKIKYHSIVMYEFFSREDFDVLIEGLDKIYEKLNPLDRSLLNYKNILQNFKGGIYGQYSSFLPNISNEKYEGKFLPNRVFHNIGNDICNLSMKIYKIIPSFAILEIKAYLDDKISDELNEIIYAYHDEIKEHVETVSGKYGITYYPDHIKAKEIYELKTDIKYQIINFLLNYFEGDFFKLSETNISVIPSIDIYSLNLPEKDDEIIDWGTNNSSFLHCFNSFIWQDTYRNNNYLFCEESSNEEHFNNYSIFATRDISKYSDMYPDVDSSIVGEFNSRPFVVLAFFRWLQIEEQIVGKFNSLISEEIEYLEKINLKSVIANRKIISKELFYFERLKVELKINNLYFFNNQLDFKSLGNEKSDLSNNVRGHINKGIEDIDEIINEINKHSNNIFNLKNIEYSKQMQDKVLILTIFIILFTFIQLYFTIKNQP